MNWFAGLDDPDHYYAGACAVCGECRMGAEMDSITKLASELNLLYTSWP